MNTTYEKSTNGCIVTMTVGEREEIYTYATVLNALVNLRRNQGRYTQAAFEQRLVELWGVLKEFDRS